MLAVEVRPEERRRTLEDLIRPPQLTHLLLQLTEPLGFLGTHPRRGALVNLGLLDPGAHRLDPVTELPSNTLHRPFFFSSRRRHTRFSRDWSSDVCSSD